MERMVIFRVHCSPAITIMIKSREMNLVWRLREQAAENCITNLGRGTYKTKSLV
jgi:hypothetical protein